MKPLTIMTVMFCLLSCTDESSDNLVEFTFLGDSHAWGSNDGSCQMRNQSSVMRCSLDIGQHDEEEDLHFSLDVGMSDVIEEGSYTDVRESATPNVDIGLWIENSSNDLCFFEAPVTSDNSQTLTITRLEDSSVRGDFQGVLECQESGETEAISASYFMILNQ